MENESNVVNPNDINPFDYYNENGVEDVFRWMEQYPPVERNSPNSLTYVLNNNDKRLKKIIYNNGKFCFKHDTGFNIPIGAEFTPFQMLQEIKFKGSFFAALNYVIYKQMNNDFPYIRVGVKYYKKIKKTDRNSIIRHELKLWDKPTIVADYGKQYIDHIPIFDDFTLEPDNINYREVIENNYNLYAPFEHTAMAKKDYKSDLQWIWTKTLLEHIFGDQYELGLKYMATLYRLPKQKLPILVLVSEERSTGKTTFIDYMDLLFGANTVIVNPEDISNQFNASYTDKNIVMIEESKFENRAALEKLKNLSTQKKILVNTKFVAQYSLPFHGKLIITSNDENKFSRIDDTEIRYWIRKIPTLQGKANHNILNDMVDEIPAFLCYLNSLPAIDTSKSRMVFEPEMLETDALRTVKKESRSSLYKDIEMLIDDWCLQNPQVKELKFSAIDFKNRYFKHDHKVTTSWIRQVFRDEFKIEPSETERAIPFDTGKIIGISNSKPMRPYIIKNPYHDPNFKEENRRI